MSSIEKVLSEAQELNQLLNASPASAPKPKPQPNKNHRFGPDSYDRYFSEDEDDDFDAEFRQWSTTDSVNFYPAGQTAPKLEPGFWEPKFNPNRGYYFTKLGWKTDQLLRFPETNSEKVINEIQNFWDKEDLFRAHNLSYKRGIILYGPPGSGKSSTIKLVLQNVIDHNGIATKFGNPFVFLECMRVFRRIQPKTPVVALMEDIDAIIEEHGETEVLNILDGVESLDKIVYLATTNYPEQLGARIINRPSRFDRRFKMPHPGPESRRLYLNHLLKQETVKDNNIDLDEWVKATEGMSVAHLKELFVAVCILGDPYEEVIGVLKTMAEDKISSDDDKISNMGFKPKR